MATTITTRVENKIVKDIDNVASKEAIDRSAVIRRFLIKSIKEWKIQKNLEDYEKGKTSLWHAAEKCDLSLWEMMDEVKTRNITVPYGLNELKEDLQ